MIEFMDSVNALSERLYNALIGPFFERLGQALEMFLLGPLDRLHVSPLVQVLLLAAMVAALSRLLRRLLRVEAHEERFRRAFAAKRENRQELNALADWKTREVLFRASDAELDEVFNTYLAERFARHGLVYLLPLFFALLWINDVFAAATGGSGSAGYLVELPANSLGVGGLSASVVFLGGYLASLAGIRLASGHGCRRRPLPPCQEV